MGIPFRFSEKYVSGGAFIRAATCVLYVLLMSIRTQGDVPAQFSIYNNEKDFQIAGSNNLLFYLPSMEDPQTTYEKADSESEVCPEFPHFFNAIKLNLNTGTENIEHYQQPAVRVSRLDNLLFRLPLLILHQPARLPVLPPAAARARRLRSAVAAARHPPPPPTQRCF